MPIPPESCECLLAEHSNAAYIRDCVCASHKVEAEGASRMVLCSAAQRSALRCGAVQLGCMIMETAIPTRSQRTEQWMCSFFFFVVEERPCQVPQSPSTIVPEFFYYNAGFPRTKERCDQEWHVPSAIDKKICLHVLVVIYKTSLQPRCSINHLGPRMMTTTTKITKFGHKG